MPAKVSARDYLLADITALGIRDQAFAFEFGKDRRFVHVDTVERCTAFDAESLEEFVGYLRRLEILKLTNKVGSVLVVYEVISAVLHVELNERWRDGNKRPVENSDESVGFRKILD